MSDCKKPCLTTTVSIFESSVGRHSMPDHAIFFAIPRQIKTTVIKEDSFSLMESLNFLGSNMGLWPGLGLFQLLEGIIAIIVALKIYEDLLLSINRNKIASDVFFILQQMLID